MRVSELVHGYQTDAASSYHGNRRLTRQHSDCLCRIIEADLGAKEVADIRTRDITLTYQAWQQRGVPMAHALIGKLRTLMNFGTTMLEDDDCARVAARLHGMRFKQGKPRQQFITHEQVLAIRRMWRMVARKAGVPDAVYNMDTRSGAITEALQSGASLDAVRKAATHSDAKMTMRYSRNEVAGRSEVQQKRIAGRAA